MMLLAALLAAIAALTVLAFHGIDAQRPQKHVSAHPSGLWSPEPELTARAPREIRPRNRLLVHRVWLYVTITPLAFFFNPRPLLSSGDWEGGLMLLVLLGCCIVLCVQQELAWRDERRIVADGEPTKGVVMRAELVWVQGYRRRGAGCIGTWSIEYNHLGRRLISRDEGFWMPAVGDIVTVLVDPQDPERIVVYPMSNFRCVTLS